MPIEVRSSDLVNSLIYFEQWNNFLISILDWSLIYETVKKASPVEER